ncbi:C40 family peptidase [Dactylosporangium sp. NPDC000521]|uniref:C40 family peptidase n=1 Tax=Dactylosporangium sp. NPDC000521 TaxID=3363975 RepID=UPI00367BE4C5
MAGSAPAHGAPAGTSPAALVSTATPPIGVRSIWYYQGGTTDARAELREVRAASRDAQRARLAQQAAAARAAAETAAGPSATGRAETVTVAGAVTRKRPVSRSSQRAWTSAAPRTGPGRQRPPAPRRAPKATVAATRAPVTAMRAPAASTWAPAAGDGSSGGVVGFALAQVGKGYGFGSAGPDRFDCSGLVAAAFRRIGISLPHQTGGLARVGRPVGRGELRPGDLVFPASGHVGIYVGGGRIVHASTERGGVKLSPIYAFSFARRVA